MLELQRPDEIARLERRSKERFGGCGKRDPPLGLARNPLCGRVASSVERGEGRGEGCAGQGGRDVVCLSVDCAAGDKSTSRDAMAGRESSADGNAVRRAEGAQVERGKIMQVRTVMTGRVGWASS